MVWREVCYRLIAFSYSQTGKLYVQNKGIEAILKQRRLHPGK